MPLRTVEIIGGGLAGLALGLGLRARGIPVRLLEAGTYPRHRVCGEFITALDENTRRELQLDPILNEARHARSVTWLEPGRRSLHHTLPAPALCLSRFHLDAAMAESFLRSGGELQTRVRTTPAPQPGRILACGRRPDSSSPWIGLKQHFRGLAVHDDLELHLGSRAYVGITQVEDDLVNVCGLFPRPRAGEDASLSARLCAVGLSSLADRLAAAVPAPGSACAVAGLAYSPSPTRCGSLGDQQGLIPPFTGNGMTVALQSAALALGPVEAWSRGGISWNDAMNSLQNAWRCRFRRRLTIGRWLHPWLLDPARRRVVHTLHRWGVFPFAPLYRLCH